MGSHASDADIRVSMNGLRQIVRTLRLSAAAAEKNLGISGAQVFVLQKLREGPCASIAELAALTVTDPSSASVVVARLAAAGLVKRTPASDDARRAELKLTAKGASLVRSSPEATQKQLIEALTRLSPSVRAGLAKGLSGLVREMGIVHKPELFFEERTAKKTTKRGVSRAART
ncbi:MAG: MarR family winged helix-turn-helix transcriptional regulator [Polyangiaceae bacterium]